MKIQRRISLICIKKCIKWILLLYFLMCAYIISIKYIRNFDLQDYVIIIGGNIGDNINCFGILILLFQYSISIYFTYLFLNFEIENSFENIILRVNSQNWIKSKMIVLLSCIFIFRIVYSFSIYIIVNNYIELPVNIIFSIIILNFILVLNVMTIFNFGRKNLILSILISFTYYIFVFLINNIILNVVILLISIFMNLLFFNYKLLKM